MITFETFGERLRHARKTREFGQEQLSLQVGCSQGGVSRMEVRKAKSSEFSYDLALALNISPVWLITGRGDMDSGQSQASEPPSLEPEPPLLDPSHVAEHIASHNTPYRIKYGSDNNDPKIPEDSILTIEPRDQAHGEIGIYKVDGLVVVGRLVEGPPNDLLLFTNKDYPNLQLKNKNVEYWGRVRFFTKKVS